jgi:hypothetical protein
MRFRSTLTPVSVLLLVVLSACGGGGGDGVATLGSGSDGDSSTDTTLSQADLEKAMTDWTTCMRGEGVDVPDFQTDADGNTKIGGPPGGAGGGTDTEGDEVDGGGDTGTGDMPSKADFEKAVKTCGEPPQLGGEISEKDRKEMQDNALEFAQCMRDEGITDFPDPDFSKMGPGAGPKIRVEDGSSSDDAAESQGPFGDIDPTTPEFQAAQQTCEAKNPNGPKFRVNANGDRSAKASANATPAS